MSKFQVILISIFGVFILIGVAAFALYRGNTGSAGSIVIWGDIPSFNFDQLLNSPAVKQDASISVSYVEKSSDTIETEFTEALAQGNGPDLIILPHDKLWKNKSKIVTIPYSSVSERDFKTTFVEEGELFLGKDGVYALPLSIDPLVLYYNRDLLSSAGQARPIQYWDEIYASATNLSKRDAAGNIISSVIALGEARNISNFKDILSLLMLQAGTPITAFIGENLHSQVSNNFNLMTSPGEAALDFYTQFSNPTKVYYSWNRSLVDAQTNFTSGDSAYYLGFAFESRALRSKNPTLNFAVSLIPQSRVSGKTVTFGRLRGVAISRSTKDQNAALTIATRLISREASKALSENLRLPPVRRDLLSTRPSDATLSVFYDAALQSKGWLDPDVSATTRIFQEAIESVTSGRARTNEAILKANKEIDTLIK